MTATQQFIEEAIAGGWKDGEQVNVHHYVTKTPAVSIGEITDPEEFLQTASILLDPLAWQAVGKTRGWEKRVTFYNRFTDGKEDNEPWRLEMHRFIDHLADGKSIEEALAAIQ